MTSYPIIFKNSAGAIRYKSATQAEIVNLCLSNRLIAKELEDPDYLYSGEPKKVTLHSHKFTHFGIDETQNFLKITQSKSKQLLVFILGPSTPKWKDSLQKKLGLSSTDRRNLLLIAFEEVYGNFSWLSIPPEGFVNQLKVKEKAPNRAQQHYIARVKYHAGVHRGQGSTSTLGTKEDLFIEIVCWLRSKVLLGGLELSNITLKPNAEVYHYTSKQRNAEIEIAVHVLQPGKTFFYLEASNLAGANLNTRLRATNIVEAEAEAYSLTTSNMGSSATVKNTKSLSINGIRFSKQVNGDLTSAEITIKKQV